MKNNKLVDMVLTGLMIALVFVAASIIKIPTFGGFVHLGDSMVFLSVIVLGKKRGAFASAVGMLFVDLFAGYVLWAPFTFVIKGVMAYVIGTILEKIEFKRLINYIIAFSVGGVVMIFGYFLAGTIMAGFLTEGAGLVQGLILASKDIVGNVFQATAGVAIAIPLAAALEKTNIKNQIYDK